MEALSENERYQNGNISRDLELAPSVGELALKLAEAVDES